MSWHTFKNPFFECTGKDIDYKDVLEYWCEPFSVYNLDERILFDCPTAYILQGARGSGKTMILKYLSFHCQIKKAVSEGRDDLFEYFSELGSIGVYLNYKEDAANLIDVLPFDEDFKRAIFKYYYELFISLQTVISIKELSSVDVKNEYMDKERFILEFNTIFGSSVSSIEEMPIAINGEIEKIDEWMRTCRYKNNPVVVFYGFAKEKLIQKLIISIKSRIPVFKNIKLMVLLDEYENMKKWQVVTNTFIKQSEGGFGLVYRVAMRPEGMIYDTMIGDNLQHTRDFILHELIVDKNNRNSWNAFLTNIAKRRFELSGYGENDRDIKMFLGFRENFEDEALRIVMGGKKDHFELLSHLELTTAQIDKLRCEHNPLIEMLNILWAIRGRKPSDISDEMACYLANRTQNTKYKRDFIDKYKYQLLLCLANYNRVPKDYYSFSTFSFLSHGSVNDFISLCRNTFIHLDNEYYDNMSTNKRIPVSVQSRGAYETALDLLNNLRLNNENGQYMYMFVKNVGNLFKNYNHIEKSGNKVKSFAQYPETNQFVFFDEMEISMDEDSSQVFKHLIKWGAITKVRRILRKSLSIPQIGHVYKINPVFSPLFSISYRTRGGHNHPINNEEFQQMLKSEVVMKPKKSRIRKAGACNDQQITLEGLYNEKI